MNMFFYKMSSKNIMLVRIALLANYIEVDGEDVWCPDWQVPHLEMIAPAAL